MTDVAGRTAVCGAAIRRTSGVWNVASPTGPPSLLNDITALSPSEAWAVGQTQNHPVIQHWDGTDWSIVASPQSAAAIGAGLLGIDAVSPTTAIAVGGAYDRLAGQEIPLIRHWDGTDWTTPALRPQISTGHVLTAVTMFSADDAWAVGHRVPKGPVALHWDGTDWTPIPIPTPARGRLLALAGTSPSDLWAVGATERTPLTMHFDGHAWRQVHCPSGDRPLTDVVALSDGSAWAAGGSTLLHWNHRRWRRIKTGLTSVNTLTALSPTDIWAAGGHSQIAHFDGTTWHRTDPTPPLDTSVSWLGSTSAAPDTIWIVGSQQTADPNRSPTLHSVTALIQEN